MKRMEVMQTKVLDTLVELSSTLFKMQRTVAEPSEGEEDIYNFPIRIIEDLQNFEEKLSEGDFKKKVVGTFQGF